MRYLVLTLALFILSRAGYGQGFTITLDSRDEVTNCVNGNGKLQVSVSPGTTSTYDYKWFNSSGVEFSSNINASNLDVGTYTIQVKRKSDGLTQSQSYTVGAALPILTAQVLQNLTNCASP